MHEVAVRGVHLDEVEPRIDGATGGGAEVVDHRCDARLVEGNRLAEALEGDRRGRDGRPAALVERLRAPSARRLWPDRRLATRMRELHARRGALRSDEPR